MTADEIMIFTGIVFVVGMFTNFYGLGTFWSNRGSWYHVTPEQLDTVMTNLSSMRAFDDSDGIPQEYITIRAYHNGVDGGLYYSVKIPNHVFKYVEYQMTEDKKLELLGLTD